MTSGLPQVCELWLGVSKGMLPVRHLAPKNPQIMAVNYCGCQLAEGLGGRHLPTIKRKVQTRILEHEGLTCNMTGGLISAFGYGLGRGI